MRVKGLKLPGVFAGTAVTALVVAACGGGGATSTPLQALTAAEYLQRLGELEDPADQASRTVGRALLEAAHVRREVLTTLREADFAGTHATLLEEVRQLHPPGDLRADHQAYLEWLRDAGVPFSQDMAAAIGADDLVAFVLARARFGVSHSTLLAGLSPAFCRTLNPEDDLLPPNNHFCDDDEGLTGGEYGVQLRALTKRIAAEFFPRAEVFRPALRENEQIEAVAAVQHDLVTLFEEVLEAAQELQPPAELQVDHDRFIQFLEETLDVSRGVLRAAEAQDFEQLFAEFRRSSLYAESAERAFSPAIRPLVATLFGEASEDQIVLTSAESQYLDRLNAGASRIEAAFDAVGRDLSQTYPTRERLMGALRQADTGGAVRALLEELRQLAPPERFRTDHEGLVGFLSDLATTGNFDQTLEDDDLVGASLARKDFLVGMGRLAQGSLPPFCRAAAFGDANAIFDDDVPGGEYGVALRQALNRSAVEFGPRVSSFPLGLATDELITALEILQPEIIKALEETGAAVRALQPPPELRADHQRIVAYWENVLVVSRAISRAVEARDTLEQQRQFRESGVVFCGAAQNLSDAIRPILGPHLFPGPGCSNF